MSSTSTRRAYVSVALFAAAFAAFCFLLAGALAVNGEAAQRGKQIKVMTRNVYLGADLTDAVMSQHGRIRRGQRRDPPQCRLD